LTEPTPNQAGPTPKLGLVGTSGWENRWRATRSGWHGWLRMPLAPGGWPAWRQKWNSLPSPQWSS